MPRVAWAIRIVLVALCVLGMILAYVFDWQEAPGLVAVGTILAIVSGVLFVLFNVIGFVNGAYVDPIEVKDYHSGSGRRRSDDDNSVSGMGDSFGD